MVYYGGEVPTMARKLTAEDKRWQAEADAQTLAEADVIRKTKGRLTAAIKQAKVMAVDAKQQATAMGKVAKIKRSTTKKATKRGR